MIQKIATAAVYVEDQQKALTFWTTQVGFEVHLEKPMGRDARWIEIGPAGASSCLVLYPKSMMADWQERKPSIVFECENVQQTFDEMRHRGVRFTQEPHEMPWGPFAIFEDTEGNWYGLRESLD
jgi:predicted enzyme related to lactoylglutathione lyase